jgi:hypothetical protein
MFSSIMSRGLALLIWAPAVYLSYFIITEFTEGQSAVIIGIAMIALLVSSVSLLQARNAHNKGDRVGTWAAGAMYALGVAVFLFFEMGYWNSTVVSSHAGMVRASAAREGADILAAKDRDALRSGALAETSGEIQAKMDAQLAQPIGNQPLSKLTTNCEDRQSAAFRLCGEYLALKTAFAKAQASEKLQQRVWNAATAVEPAGKLKRDLFAGATAVAGVTGVGTPEGWAMTFSALMVLLLTVTRDLSLMIAFAPLQRRAAAPEPQEVTEAPEAPAIEPTPVPAPRPTSPAPHSTPPGRRMSETAVQEIRDRLSEDNVVELKPRAELPAFASTVFEESAPPVAKRTAEKKRKNVGRAAHWMSECTERASDPNVICDHSAAWDSYRIWCHTEDMSPLPRQRFLRAVNARVGTAPGQRAFIGLLLTGIEIEKARAVA